VPGFRPPRRAIGGPMPGHTDDRCGLSHWIRFPTRSPGLGVLGVMLTRWCPWHARSLHSAAAPRRAGAGLARCCGVWPDRPPELRTQDQHKLYSFFPQRHFAPAAHRAPSEGLATTTEAVDLRRKQHLGAAYKAVPSQGWCRRWQTDATTRPADPVIGHHRMAEEAATQPPLLPPIRRARARVRALAAIVRCDIHPVNNRRNSTSYGASSRPSCATD